MKSYEGYLKLKLGENYVHLTNGGHKPLSDFLMSSDASNTYVKKIGDAMSGDLSVPHIHITNTVGSDEITFARGNYNYLRAKTTGGKIGFVTDGKDMTGSSVDFAVGNGWVSINNGTSGAGSYNLYVNGSINATTIYKNGTEVEKVGHTLSYTTLTGSGTTANQAIVSSGTTNGWTLKTLGSLAFSNNALEFYSLYGGNLYGDINFAHVNGSTPAYILANSGTNRLRFIIWDGLTALFEFLYSDDTGSTWPSAFTINRDSAKIGTNTIYHSGNLKAFVGATSSTAGTAGYIGTVPSAGNTGLFFRSDNSWATPTNTTYKLKINNSTNGDSANGVDLGTIYAPTSNGTGFLKGTAGSSGAITWYWDNSNYATIHSTYGTTGYMSNVTDGVANILNYSLHGVALSNASSSIVISECSNGGSYTDVCTINSNDSSYLYGLLKYWYYQSTRGKKVKLTITGPLYVKGVAIHITTSDSTNTASIDVLYGNVTSSISTWGSWHMIPFNTINSNTVVVELNTSYKNASLKFSGFRLAITNGYPIFPGDAYYSSLTSKLATSRTLTIGDTGKSFDGSQDVSWTLAEIGALAAGSYASATHDHDSVYLKKSGGTMSGDIKWSNSYGCFLWESGSWYLRISTYDSGSTTAKVFSFEESQGTSGNSYTELFAIYGNGTVTATTFSGALSGNATTATTLLNSRTIWGQSFNGSGNVSGALSGVHERFEFSRENWNYIIVPANNGNLGFNVGAAGTSLSYLRMCITNAGRVGIGTASPGWKLDCLGAGHFTSSSWGDQLYIYRSDGANNALITFKNTSGVIGYLGIAGSNDRLGVVPIYCTSGGTNYMLYHTGNLPAYPTKSSWNYDDRYLKLTGGTLSGDLNFSHASSATDLKITSASGSHYLRIRIRDGYDDTFYFEYSTNSGSSWTTYACIKGSGTYAPNFYTTSDSRKKKNIHKISKLLPIVEFDWRESGEHSYGFIAQELESLGYLELVSGLEEKTVNYNAALSLCVAQLSNIVEDNKLKIKELEAKILELERRVT